MKNYILRLLAFIVLVSIAPALSAQASAKRGKSAEAGQRSYPETFHISEADFAQLLAKKEKDVFTSTTNHYLNQAVVLRSVANGDMRFMRLQLHYFKGGYLHVQVNGAATTQIFVFSDDKSFFYKASLLPDGYLMSRCAEDEIVSE